MDRKRRPGPQQRPQRGLQEAAAAKVRAASTSVSLKKTPKENIVHSDVVYGGDDPRTSP